jgi:peptide/nickel transport system substrate-binding protein
MPQSELTVKKFKNYWGKGEGKPYLDKIIFKEVPDAMIRLTMLKAGTVDIITDLNPKQAVEIKKDGKFKLVKMPPARWRSMQWRMDKEPFSNRAFREAVAYGIDREAVNKTIFYGEGIPAVGPVVPGLWWYEDDFKGYTFNPEQAKKKLAEAGYSNGITQKFYVTNRQVNVQTAEIIQSQLAKVGINAELVMVNAAESYSRMLSGQSDWADPRWTQRSDPHGLLYILFHSKGHANSTKYSNPEVDRLIDEASTIFDQDKRKELYFKAVRLITMDAPYVYIVYVPEWAAMRPEVHGFKWIPDLIPRYSFLWKEK